MPSRRTRRPAPDAVPLCEDLIDLVHAAMPSRNVHLNYTSDDTTVTFLTAPGCIGAYKATILLDALPPLYEEEFEGDARWHNFMEFRLYRTRNNRLIVPQPCDIVPDDMFGDDAGSEDIDDDIPAGWISIGKLKSVRRKRVGVDPWHGVSRKYTHKVKKYIACVDRTVSIWDAPDWDGEMEDADVTMCVSTTQSELCAKRDSVDDPSMYAYVEHWPLRSEV